jgi:hypothetical protein
MEVERISELHNPIPRAMPIRAKSLISVYYHRRVVWRHGHCVTSDVGIRPRIGMARGLPLSLRWAGAAIVSSGATGAGLDFVP